MYLSFTEIVDDMLLNRMSEKTKCTFHSMSEQSAFDMAVDGGLDIAIRVYYDLNDPDNPFVDCDTYLDECDHPTTFSENVIRMLWKRLQ